MRRGEDDGRGALTALFAGRAAALAGLVPTLDRALGARQPVLVAGEPGTGKTTVAGALHRAGPSRGGPLVVAEGHGPDVRGAAARAAGGTLVVEEVGGLAAPAQAALVEALGDVDRGALRLVATTRLDLDLAARRGWLLPALRDRLSVLRLRLPPLREEPPAAAALVRARLGAGARLGDDAAARLGAHPWPGNVREAARVGDALAAWVEAARGAVVGVEHVERALAVAGEAAPAPASAAAPGTLDALERAAVAARLAAHGWRQAETAASLGIDRKTLWRKVRAWGLLPPGEGGP